MDIFSRMLVAAFLKVCGEIFTQSVKISHNFTHAWFCFIPYAYTNFMGLKLDLFIGIKLVFQGFSIFPFMAVFTLLNTW